ncbi:MAG: molybdate ABC transporter substrate-binding protein [Planctomycetota bacterium]
MGKCLPRALVMSCFLVLSLASLVGGCGEPSEAAAERRVTVAAAASLRELLERTAPLFQPPGEPVRLSFSFEASSTLARQILEGAPYDVLLSADEASVYRLGENAPAATRRVVLGNHLVMVGCSDLKNPPTTPQQLAERLTGAKAANVDGRPLRVVLAGPEVPAGKYARAMLERAGLLESVAAGAAVADNVRAALALVASGAADVGFVYATDAAIAPGVQRLWTAPEDALPPIRYVAAVLATAGSPWAEAYLDFLGSEAFLREAEALGFLRAPPP